MTESDEEYAGEPPGEFVDVWLSNDDESDPVGIAELRLNKAQGSPEVVPDNFQPRYVKWGFLVSLLERTGMPRSEALAWKTCLRQNGKVVFKKPLEITQSDFEALTLSHPQCK
jgi:hypothetical protein